MRESKIELCVERDDFAAEPLQYFRGKSAGRAIAASDHHFQFAFEFWPVRKIADIAIGKILYETVRAALAIAEFASQHDVFETRHFIGAESQRPFCAHFHARPAIVVVRG